MSRIIKHLGRAAFAAVAALAIGAAGAPVRAQEPTGEITLNAYSGIFQDNYQRAVVEPFMRRFPNVRVTYFPGQNSAQMLGQLRAQRASPQSDVVIMDVSVQRVGNDEGLFARLDPAQVPNLTQLFDLARPAQEGFGPAVTFDHLTVIYNTQTVTPPPASLRDLWDARFRPGKLAILAAPDIVGLAFTILVNHTNGGDYRQNIDAGIRRLQELADPRFASLCLQTQAWQAQVPVTAHVAVGTDTPHTHPAAVGADIGAATHHDFRLLCSLVRDLDDGGVYINAGSAVVLPEVFLKAVSVVRNLGHPLARFTTVNLDFLQHYRPVTNVVHRPHAQSGGKGYSITGHHEIMIPLLAAILREAGPKEGA